MLIKGRNISLRRLEPDDASEEYAAWLNCPEINRCTESRFSRHTMLSLIEFINSVNNDFNYAFAIIDNLTQKHIGNIKIGNINIHHKNADIGLIIGNREFWGKGVATEAIKMCVDFGFNELGLHRLWAGIYESNTGSVKAFKKAGFILEGTKKEAVLLDGKWLDCYIYGLVNHEE